MRSRFLLFIWHYFKQLRARREGFGGKTAGITTLLRDTSLHDLCHFWHNIFKNRSRFCASSSKTNEGCVCLCETAARQIYFFVLFSKKAFIRVWWIKLGKCCLVTYSGEGANATDDKLVFCSSLSTGRIVGQMLRNWQICFLLSAYEIVLVFSWFFNKFASKVCAFLWQLELFLQQQRSLMRLFYTIPKPSVPSLVANTSARSNCS